MAAARLEGVSQGSLAPTAPPSVPIDAPAEAAAPPAVEELVAAHQRGLLRFLGRYVGDQEDARDLAQEAFVRALSGARRFRGDAQLRTWLFRIARNLAVDHLRKRGRGLPLPAEPTAAPRDAEHADLVRLRAAVRRLPRRQREVVELRSYEEMTFPEIAEVLHTTALAARVSHHFALKRLRKEMGEP
jgi:RNA polymerase sigma-70 factor (ECF subfamily)